MCSNRITKAIERLYETQRDHQEQLARVEDILKHWLWLSEQGSECGICHRKEIDYTDTNIGVGWCQDCGAIYWDDRHGDQILWVDPVLHQAGMASYLKKEMQLARSDQQELVAYLWLNDAATERAFSKEQTKQETAS